jgi:hypothetical protein
VCFHRADKVRVESGFGEQAGGDLEMLFRPLFVIHVVQQPNQTPVFGVFAQPLRKMPHHAFHGVSMANQRFTLVILP